MARKSTNRLELENEELQRQLKDMRTQLENQTTAAGLAGARVPELMVGIRNVSDYSVGIPIKDGNDIQLAPDFGGDDPGCYDVISYELWRKLRRGKQATQGLIMRDDSFLGGAFNAGPADRNEDFNEEHFANRIPDPVEWITTRTEKKLRDDIAKITSLASLFRLRRVVDTALGKLEDDSGMPRDTIDNQVKCAQWALDQLDGKLRLVDRLVTSAIESKFDTPIPNVEGNRITLRG